MLTNQSMLVGFSSPPLTRRMGRRLRAGSTVAAAPPSKPSKSFFEDADPTQGVREMWGQNSKKDLIKEKDNLLWNVNWEAQMDKEKKALEKTIAEREAIMLEDNPRPKPAPEKPTGSGFLSMSRSLGLDDMTAEFQTLQAKQRDALDVATLRPAEPVVAPDTISMEEALKPLQSAFKSTKYNQYTTRGERRDWGSSRRFLRSSSSREAADAAKGDDQQLSAREADLLQYETLKSELLLLTLGTTAFTTVSIFPFYGQQTTVSYLVGAAGSVAYLRLLAKSVDQTSPGGVGSVGGVIEQTVGGQRLLIPAILAAVWNRWNALYAGDFGFELEILPILAGFFTYKAAAIIQLFRDLLPSPTSSSGGDGEAAKKESM